MLRFTSTATGEELLAEQPIHWWWPGPRMFTPTGNGYHRLEQSFRAYEGERLCGLGQHGHGLLDQKGTVHLDEERKAAMVSNLLVVLCGERAAQPVLNTGTMYH